MAAPRSRSSSHIALALGVTGLCAEQVPEATCEQRGVKWRGPVADSLESRRDGAMPTHVVITHWVGGRRANIVTPSGGEREGSRPRIVEFVANVRW